MKTEKGTVKCNAIMEDDSPLDDVQNTNTFLSEHCETLTWCNVQ